MPFRIQSLFCLDILFKSTSPSSLYKPADYLSSLFDNKNSIGMPTSSQISAPSKLPMVMWKQFSAFFFFQGLLSRLIINVSTNALKEFLNLIDQHYPKSRKRHAIFNKNTVKVSYSCTQNMSSIIKYHNKNVMNKDVKELNSCNCRGKSECTLNG